MNSVTRQRQAWNALSQFFGASFASKLTTEDFAVHSDGEIYILRVRTPKGGRISVSVGHLHAGDGEGSVDIFVSSKGRFWDEGDYIAELHDGEVVMRDYLNEVRQDLREWLRASPEVTA